MFQRVKSEAPCTVRTHALLTALSLADHPELHLLFAGPHVQLTLAVVGAAVAAAHGLVGIHALRRAHALAALGVADRPERAVGTSLVWMEATKEGDLRLRDFGRTFFVFCLRCMRFVR